MVLSTAPLISAVLVYDAMHREEEQLVSFEEARKSFERDYLVRVLKISGGNVTQAARLAKRNRTEFYKLLQRYQLDPSVFKQPARLNQARQFSPVEFISDSPCIGFVLFNKPAAFLTTKPSSVHHRTISP